MSEPAKTTQDKKLIGAIENYVWSMNTQILREWITNELTYIYFSDTLNQEDIDDFIEENSPNE